MESGGETTIRTELSGSRPSLRRCGWAFLILGPAIGWVLFMLLAMSPALSDIESFKWWTVPGFLLMGAALSPIGIPMAFLIGAVPAGVTGLVYWALRRRIGVRTSIGVSVLCSIATGSAWGLVVAGPAGGETPSLWPLAPVFGLVVTPICAMIVERYRREQSPDGSFKSSPS